MPIDPVSGLYIPSPPAGYGYGGPEYGFSPYGGALLPRSPYPPGGGYGGSPYGTGPYGSSDITSPRVTSAQSLDGSRVEVFFSEEMKDDAVLKDATNYTFTPTLGAPATATSVAGGVKGSYGGYTSVIVTHSGTTLGGSYLIAVSGVTDLSDNEVDSVWTASFYSLGSTPTFTVTPTAGDSLQVDFSQDMLTETEFSPGIETTSAYVFTSSYPVTLAVTEVDQPQADQVVLTVKGQTTAAYTAEIGPATAIDYDGDVLPTAATGFTGVEVGVGSSAVAVSGLLLTKAEGDTYGWSFQDTTGKIQAGSSYRVDLVIDPTSATYSPALGDTTLGTWIVSDGSVQLSISLKRVSSVDVLDIVSGSYTAQVPAAWSSNQSKITVVRNQKGSLFGFLFNDTPLLSAASTALDGSPTISPGCQFTLGVTHGVTQLPLKSLDFTSSQTVFSSAWNFVHGGTTTFTGDDGLALSTLQTQRGPLVKGWGDGTPAAKEDVTVRVNGTAVTISQINPYTGLVTLATPIPRMPIGEMTVQVDYTWFQTPLISLSGLNTLGLVLNQWDHPQGRNTTSTSSPNGVAKSNRFPMSVVLGPPARKKPKFIGHRYMGFEREQSALLNSSTLLLNRDPHRAGLHDMTRTPPGVAIAFEGPDDPQSSGWGLTGTESGSGNFADKTWIVDDQGATTAAVYHREGDFSYSSSVTDSARILVESYTATGVFCGVGFGFHNSLSLFLAGCLDVNGVKHIGLLKDASRPDLVASWQIGLGVQVEITAATTFSATTSLLPQNIAEDTRLQVLSGNQAGIYTVSSISHLTNGTSTVVLKSSFPADYKLWGNDNPTVYFETDWSSTLTTLRLAATPETGQAELHIAGELAGKAASLSSATAFPAQTGLLLPTGDQGQFFFGSLSEAAKSRSRWAFRRYGVTPDATTYHSRGVVVAAEMGAKPENDSNNKWFITQSFGTSEIDSSGDTLLLRGSSGGATTFGYGRVEPHLTAPRYLDLDAHFWLDSGTAPGDATLVIDDATRKVQLGTLLYQESGSTRSLLTLSEASLSGLETPAGAGWTAATGLDITAAAENSLIRITQVVGQTGTWFSDLKTPASGGRIIEARAAVLSYTANGSDEMGPVWGAEVGTAPAARTVAVGFLANPARVILHSDGTPIATFSFDWTDAAHHVYRVLADPTTGVVSLLVDDVLQGTATLTDFTLATTDTMAFVGAMGADTAFSMDVDSFSVQELPPATAKRTLGIFVGTTPGDIDHWRLPRTDGTDAVNSSTAATLQEMDWRSPIRLRLHRDPAWGVSLLRPDMDLPSGYDGDFATETTEPSAAWINVEYRDLPRSSESFGMVRWGALGAGSITQQRWKEVRYRIYQYPTEDFISPHHMVLNRGNIIHSGELGTDVSVETVVVTPLTATLVSLRPAHINASRVFSVTAGGVVLSSSAWTFDADAQTITLTTALTDPTSGVTVTFAPGGPVTSTYLQGQAFHQTVTRLNEGTPPFPKSELGTTTTEVQHGSRVNDPNDTLGDMDFILNDPYRTVQTKDPDARYESLDFFEADDGGEEGLLSMLCDGPAIGEGLIEITLEGTQFTEQAVKSDALIQDSLDNSHQQTSLFFCSGGVYTGGTLGPGTMLLWPNAQHSGQSTRSPTRKRVSWDLKIRSVLTDANDVGSETALEDTVALGTDNAPPATVDGGNGTAGAEGNGAAAYRITDGAGLYSRAAPWGPGLVALNQESLLAGGVALDGSEFVLLGGAAVDAPTITDGSVEAAN